MSISIISNELQICTVFYVRVETSTYSSCHLSGIRQALDVTSVTSTAGLFYLSLESVVKLQVALVLVASDTDTLCPVTNLDTCSSYHLLQQLLRLTLAIEVTNVNSKIWTYSLCASSEERWITSVHQLTLMELYTIFVAKNWMPTTTQKQREYKKQSEYFYNVYFSLYICFQ